MIVSVQTAPTDGTESFVRRFGRPRRSVLLLVMLAVFCGAVWGQTPAGEDAPPDQSGAPAVIEGFRQARFGMNEEQVKQAIRKDFPEAAGKLAHAIHPTEKTTVLSLTVADLLPHSGNARISYILGHRSRKLGQVNIVWSSDGLT